MEVEVEEAARRIASADQYLYLGRGTARLDAAEMVFGRPIYTSDLLPENIVYVKVVRAPHPHALIKRIDVSAAAGMRGVLAVLTHRDIPGKNLSSTILSDRPLLAHDKTRCIADALALVVAETPLDADEAAEHVRIEYEELPVVSDPLEALKPGSPKIHEEGNLAAHYKVRKGDVEKGFQESDVIVEDTYHTPFQEPAPLEPEAAFAYPDSDGGITIVGSIQNPFYVRAGVARILGLPQEKVRIIVPAMGGSFGGKSDEAPWDVSAFAALASMRTGRPAACIYARDESIIAHSKRHSFTIHHRLGATGDGLLKAAEVEIYADTGAYASVGPHVLLRAVVHAAGPYIIPHVKVDGYLVYTNNTMAGSMRGFGNPQVHFAAESQIDRLARRLGMDPLELRLRNILRDGSITPTGQRLVEKVSLEECLRVVASRLGWSERRKREGVIKRGLGIAAVFHGNSMGPEGLDRSEAEVEIDVDGTVRVRTGLTEYGTGASTSLAQIASEALGIPLEKVVVERVDTSRSPDSGGTFASRTVAMGGGAIKIAAERLRKKIEVMMREMGFKGEITDFIASKLKEPVSERAEFTLPLTDFDPEKGHGTPYLQYTWGAVGVEVEVDSETGEVTVSRVVAAFDVGRALRPSLIKGQIEGGIAQGLGLALMEELIHKDGWVKNPNLADYYIPTFVDVPEIESIILENPGVLNPLGTRTIGEPPICGPAPAVANAVEDAVGVRITSLPITAEKVLLRLLGKVKG